MIKYSKEHEQAVIDIFIKMNGKTLEDIAKYLNSQGLLTARGKPWKLSSAANFYYTRKNRINGTATPSVSRLVVEALITEPSLNDRQRVKMIEAYLNA